MMKKIFLLLLACSLSFAFLDADWQRNSLFACFVAFLVLLVVYLMSYLANAATLRGMAVGEMTQVLVSIVLFAMILGMETYFTETLPEAVAAAVGEGGNHIDYAALINKEASDYSEEKMREITNSLILPMGSCASTTGTCSLLGLGFSYAGCGGIQLPVSSLTLALNTMVASDMILSAQAVLLALAKSFFFPVLLPLGLFLRCFQFTRGLGGFLMAAAFSFYFLLPAGIILAEGLSNAFLKDYDTFGDVAVPGYKAPETDIDATNWAGLGDDTAGGPCDPFSMKIEFTRGAIAKITDTQETFIEPMVFFFMIKGFLNVTISIAVVLAGLRGLASIFGSEVEVSALARIS